jgi:hypothetical protein
MARMPRSASRLQSTNTRARDLPHDERAYQVTARQRLIDALEAREESGLDALRQEVEREQQKAEQGRPARTLDDIARRWARAAKAARQQHDAAKVRLYKAAAEAAVEARSE